MKPKHLIFIIGFFLLSSCIVKSLHPFYTKDILFFEQKFVGQWIDDENSLWNVTPFQESFLKESQKNNASELSEEDLKLYSTYKDGYLVYYEKDSTKATFLAMPFKINNQLFLDFTPIENSEMELLKNNLYKMHLINTHTLVKLDIKSNESANIRWLSEDKLKALFEENRIKIKHEKVGFDETVVLTASSEELVKFIEKFMASKDQDKWKTDIKFDLKRINE